MRPKGTPEQLEARRRRALALLKEGYGVRQTAQQVGCSPGSVVYWKKLLKKGEAALKAKPHPHRPCRLSLKQKQRLLKLLLKGPLAFGFQDQLWTLPRIARLIKEHFGVTYHPAHVWKLLHSLGWSCQKPQRRCRKQNEQEVEQWRRKRWPHIKKRPKTKQGHYLPG